MVSPDRDAVDPAQIADLESHFRSLSDDELKEAYQKTIRDSESDKNFGYSHGATQASTTRNIAVIQSILDERNLEY